MPGGDPGHAGVENQMSLRLLQVELAGGKRRVAALDDDRRAVSLDGVASTYELAGAALAEDSSLEEAARERMTGEAIDVGGTSPAVRLLPPIDHPDPAHLYLTGTGLTHLGSAQSRDQMHALAATAGAQKIGRASWRERV